MSAQPAITSENDPKLAQILDEYLAALETGAAPSRQELFARYPEQAEDLKECLASLEFIRHAAVAPVAPPDDGGDSSAGDMPTGVLGDFRILRQIGRGGMGIVYEAVQISLDRRVALKVLPFASTLDAKQLQRFKNEAQAAAGLQHTNIVPVYFVGCERGVHFYAMQFVEGQTLAALIQELRQLQGQEASAKASGAATKSWAAELISAETAPPWVQAADPKIPSSSPLPPFVPPYQQGVGLVPSPAAETITPPVGALSTEHSTSQPAFFRTVAKLGIQAAEALEHAHSLGVIHRDIKPGNLMVDARGNLWIADFGLAHCQGACDLTMSGDLLGTLRYMSPEQALAKRVIVDERTDIYSLGVTLYELLTLQPAFPGTDRQEVLRQIAFEEPKPPRRSNKAIPVELETIVLKAMEKNPADRYATAKEMAEDLQHFLDDKPIRAKRPTPLQRFRKWARRHPGVAWMTVWLLVVLALGSTVSTMLIAHQRDLADARAREADDNAAEATGRLYISHMLLAQRAWDDAQIGRLLELLEGQRPEHTGGKELRGFEWHYWWRLCHSDLLTLRGHQGAVSCVAYSPDGRRIVSGSLDNTVKVWDAVTGKEILTYKGHTRSVSSVAYSPDSNRIVSGSGSPYEPSGPGELRIWDAASGQEILILTGHADHVSSIAYSSDGKRIASGSQDKTIKVWNAATGQEILALKGHTSGVLSLAFSPDGKRIVSSSFESTKIWDAATGEEILTLKGHTASVSSVAYSPDGKRIVTGSLESIADGKLEGGTLKVSDAATGQEYLTLKGHKRAVSSLAFSPDGKSIVSGSWDNTIKVWDVGTGREALTLKGHTSSGIMSVGFSPDGKRVVSSGGWDNTIKVWDAITDQESSTLKGHGSVVAYSPDGKRVVSNSGNDVHVWDATTGQQNLTLKGHANLVQGVAFSSDGNRIVSGSEDNTVKVWDAATGHEILTLNGHKQTVMSVGYSPDGSRIVSGSYDNNLKVWDAGTGQEILTLKGHTKPVMSVGYSPDGKRIVSGSQDETLKVWDAISGREILTLKGHPDEVMSVAYSPDGRRIVSGSTDKTLKIWDAATGQETLTLKGHTRWVWNVSYSPDGKRIVSSSQDNTIKVWEAETGQETLTLKGHTTWVWSWVWSVAFSPDGNRIVSGSGDNTINMWDATPMEDIPVAGAGR